MCQQRASRDEATRISGNEADAKRMSKHIVSRDGVTRAPKNAADAVWMRQQRASRYESVCTFEILADAKRMS